jgi:hypothetical protein
MGANTGVARLETARVFRFAIKHNRAPLYWTLLSWQLVRLSNLRQPPAQYGSMRVYISVYPVVSVRWKSLVLLTLNGSDPMQRQNVCPAWLFRVTGTSHKDTCQPLVVPLG